MLPYPTSPHSLAALRRFAFDDDEQHVDCGSAVVFGAEAAAQLTCSDADDEAAWTAKAAAFLAGEPVTFSWLTPSPSRRDGEQVYVCCWVTLGD